LIDVRLGRILYFLLWPHFGYDGVHCEPENIGHRQPPSNALIKALAIVPASFFIAAFSINVYTFGRIYHGVLRLQQHQRPLWMILPVILIILNISVSGEIWMWAVTSSLPESMMENLGGSISASLVTTSSLLVIFQSTRLSRVDEPC
jgi:H+/Cl- antiporter ClcA